MDHLFDSSMIDGSSVLGRYEILSKIGEGSFGRVYKARQAATGQEVAIKVLRIQRDTAAPAVEKQIARFKREMQLCATLYHPNIVRLIDSGAVGSELFIVFELVPGKNLAEVLLEEGALSAKETRRLMSEVLDALCCAHDRGVVHRDLKPQNIMVTSTGARRHAMVLDFGIAAITKEGQQPDGSPITGSNEGLGTPAYAAPEQLRGEEPTPRSDLYTLALVFLECLSGKRVINGNTLQAVLYKQLGPEPITLPEALLQTPMVRIVQSMLVKDVHERRVSAAGLLQALEDCPL